jgi:uncharacterized membrane protein (UPF0182 family)
VRYPDDVVRGRRRHVSPRARAWIIAVVAVLVALVLSARAIAGFYTDYLWFDSVHHTDTWSTILQTKVLLATVFVLIFFGLIYGNLLIADRVAPVGFRGPEDELLVRYREFVTPRRRLLRFVVSFLFALIAGIGASGQWNNWLLFRNGGSFGITDPVNHKDLGFYVFKLPFLSYVLGWLFASVVVVLLIVTVIHYLNGGIRLQVAGQRVTPQVKAHLSVLLAVLALLKAADYWLEQYQLLMSDRGVVKGATYTDVNAQLPAIKLLLLISLLSAILFLVNIRQRGWTLPIVATGLWVLVALVAGAIYPWFIQTFQVARKESAREAPYIARNISATRAALGLDKVKVNSFDYTPTPTDQAITNNAATVRNIRLLDPSVSLNTYKNLESQLAYYQFTDLDVDRYPIGPDQSTTQVVLGTRELNPDKIPNDSWESQHLIYTHGYGVALAPANTVTDKGRPDFQISGVPITINPAVASVMPIDRPEIYFGNNPGLDSATDYAIARTKRSEVSSQFENTTYKGTGGVQLKGFVRRAAFFLRFGDLQTLTSDYLTDQSRVLYHRDVADRVKEVAPFLRVDHDPYPVIVDGRIKFVVDAYTTASTYPYGQTADTSQLDSDADLASTDFNYMRNSVKAVVDAYDGTVDLYMTDTLYGKRDPIIRAYAAAFPKLLKTADQMPKDLRSHLRYPEDMFRVQTAMWGQYHTTSPGAFYDQSDRWDVAQDPGTDITPTTTATGQHPRIDPYYLLMKLPNSKSVDYLLFRPYVPHSDDDSKQKLTSFIVGTSDPDNYGQLQTFRMTTLNADGTRQPNPNVDGPLIANSNILSDTDSQVSQTITLLERGGSKVDFGNLLMIPIDKSLLYVRPIYVRADTTDSPDVLRKVAIAIGERVAVGDTLRDALAQIFPTATIDTAEPTPTTTPGETGSPPPTQTGGGTPTTTPPTTAPTSGDPSALIGQALTLFQEADDALKSGGAGGLSDYQAKTQQAEDLIRQAQAELGGQGTTTTVVGGAS